MKLAEIARGRAFRICALDLSEAGEPEHCPAKDFIADVHQNNPASMKALTNVLRQHSEFGAIKNDEKSRVEYEGPDGKIYAFKTQQGARLLYFYEANRLTILTHGFYKGRPLKPEIKKAREYRNAWRRERDGTDIRRQRPGQSNRR